MKSRFWWLTCVAFAATAKLSAVAQAQPVVGAPASAEPASPEPAIVPAAPSPPADTTSPPPATPATPSGPHTTSPATSASEETDAPCSESGECVITDLKTPTSPATTIVVGAAPSESESPRTPKDIAITLYNAFKNGALPQDLSLEAAPYWLVPHSTLTYEEYMAASAIEQLGQNFTLSVATAGSKDSEEVPFTDVGFGARTSMFFPLGAQQETLRKAEAALDQLQAVALSQSELSDCPLAATPAEPSHCAHDREVVRAVGDPSKLEESLKKGSEALQTAVQSRDGLGVRLAGALAFRSPNDSFSLKNFTRGAVWLTLGLRLSQFDASLVGRFVGVDTDGDVSAKFLDVGGRVGLLKPQYGLYAECIYRTVSGDSAIDNSVRATGTFELAVMQNLYVSATFGKALADETSSGGVVSLLGISFQAARARKVKLPQSVAQ